METHEYANLLPMMQTAEYSALLEDMRAGGYDETLPVVLLDGKILDGRNRYKAANELGIRPSFTDYTGDDPLGFVIRHNLNRRHLNESQRAVIASRVANMTKADGAKAGGFAKHGVLPSANLPMADISQPAAAAMLNVSERSVRTVKAVERQAPELIAAIESGTISGHDASKIAKAEPMVRREAVAMVERGEVRTAQDAVNVIKKQVRAEYIAEQREQVSELKAPDVSGGYNTIVIDPPWAYGTPYDPDGRRVANPYPEMEQAELMRLSLPSADDCVLFLWTTHRFVWDAKELLQEWGFSYRSMLVWDKEKIGMGDLFRMQCEFCLVGIKGRPIIDNNHTWRDIIREPRREHSRKPDGFYDMVDALCVGRKLDYFSRTERSGWHTFGNEAGRFA